MSDLGIRKLSDIAMFSGLFKDGERMEEVYSQVITNIHICFLTVIWQKNNLTGHTHVATETNIHVSVGIVYKCNLTKVIIACF
jgi:hypothetical protein